MNVKPTVNNDIRFHVSGYPIETDTTGSGYMRRGSREQYNVRRLRVVVETHLGGGWTLINLHRETRSVGYGRTTGQYHEGNEDDVQHYDHLFHGC
jgi:hypothetical protein